MTEPGCMDSTISLVIKMGASLPGTRAEVITISDPATTGLRASRSFSSHSGSKCLA